MGLVLTSALFAQEPTVNSQWPSNTIYSGTTVPGVEVDLGRSWTEHVPDSGSSVQWRVGLTSHMDVLFNKDFCEIRLAKEVIIGTALGVQASWGHDYSKLNRLVTQKISGDFYIDLNLARSKSLKDASHTVTQADDVYYSKDEWAFGVVFIPPTHPLTTHPLIGASVRF
jgi:hypothetical protein